MKTSNVVHGLLLVLNQSTRTASSKRVYRAWSLILDVLQVSSNDKKTNNNWFGYTLIGHYRSKIREHHVFHLIATALWLESQSFSDRWFLQLSTFIDHSVIEVFEPEGGRVAITTRVYPEEETAENIAVYVNESPTTNQSIILNTFDIWTLDSIWT